MNGPQKQDKYKALSITIVVHALLVMAFIMMSIDTPPPIPNQDLGMEVNLGTSDDGMGEVQPLNPNPPAAADDASTASQPETNPATQTGEQPDYATQDEEEAPEVKKPEKVVTPPKELPKNIEPKKDNKPKPKPADKPTETKPEPAPKPKATYKGGTGSAANSGNGADGSNNSTGEGNTGKPGDRGKIDGDPNAKGYDGNGGLGGGKSDFRLAGRSLKSAPRLTYDGPETGYVVVQIKVNQNGQVTSASIIPKGTTITSSSARELARKAALELKYSANDDAPTEQFGTVKIYFKSGQ
ncbi:outer membrane biosynthesis protein TonB [Chitinophaga skermanii]|uniref:Outer membrane biosynthesis protein TonB n=1 Tax=Chitinophaga skermanii TaxID=331697 RepID=A0A327QT78_9BACT|nr:energy transducer TonB [Chitinophaga skermanii]RAJ06902.1 outer membrane biosynthesis protein TonB [Chitinophaga skermanii]